MSIELRNLAETFKETRLIRRGLLIPAWRKKSL